jgi:hypothetical protein
LHAATKGPHHSNASNRRAHAPSWHSAHSDTSRPGTGPAGMRWLDLLADELTHGECDRCVAPEPRLAAPRRRRVARSSPQHTHGTDLQRGRAATADGYTTLNRGTRTAHRGMAAWRHGGAALTVPAVGAWNWNVRARRPALPHTRQSCQRKFPSERFRAEVSNFPGGSFRAEVSGRKFPGGSFQAEARPSVRRSRLYVGLVAQRCERQSHRTLAPTRSPPLMKCSSSHAVRRNVAYALPTGVQFMEPKGRGPRDRSGRRRRAQGECGLHCIACAGGPQAHRCK